METRPRFAAHQAASILIDDLLINVNGPDRISDSTWAKYVEWGKTIPLMPLVLTFSPYHGPNAAQRTKLISMLQKRGWRDAHIALLTDSAFVRGVMTVFGWFTPIHTKPFRPHAADSAMTWLARSGRFDRTEARTFLREAIVEVGFKADQRDDWLGAPRARNDDAAL